jgi:glycosyltransferase involved in cell wall biosynthesis
VYYIQGVFGFRNVILPILIGSKPVVSPHGMLQEGAITKKKLVKIIYLRVLKFFLKFKNSHFIVTDSNERNEVLYFFGNVKTSVIPLPLSTIDMVVTSREKIRGQLHLVYYSVISEKKNLIFLLDVMKKVNGPVKLTIFGPIQDENYWSRCNKNISNSTLLKNSVCYKGSLLFMDYYKMCQEYDYFVLPTKGENFGYAVLENLGCGLPVVISDCTPWVFNEGSGLFSLPLENFSAWVSTIQELINQSDTDYKLARSRARDYYENFMSKTSKIGLYEKFFESNYF